MITELEIKGFRGFEDFSMHDLGRINLLVGSNNGGKTSVLEAIQLLAAQGNFNPFYDAAMRRGEFMWSDSRVKGSLNLEIDISLLFYGYKMEPGSQFTIHGKRKTLNDKLQAEILENKSGNIDSAQLPLFHEHDEYTSPYILTLNWGNQIKPLEQISVLSYRGGLPVGSLARHNLSGQTDKVLFISTASLIPDEIVGLLEDIILTSEEQFVIDSIKIIEPGIERIAPIGSERKRISSNTSRVKGGVVVKCKGTDQRIPIGSMGDGIWRILGITLALVKAEGGILLIDEIDTGLHFTVMENMWKLIAETAERLNVQVFATTHNSDCWTSLASVLCDKNAVNDKVSIQRIEKDKKQAVAFTKDEIIIAAEREIEVR